MDNLEKIHKQLDQCIRKTAKNFGITPQQCEEIIKRNKPELFKFRNVISVLQNDVRHKVSHFDEEEDFYNEFKKKRDIKKAIDFIFDKRIDEYKNFNDKRREVFVKLVKEFIKVLDFTWAFSIMVSYENKRYLFAEFICENYKSGEIEEENINVEYEDDEYEFNMYNLNKINLLHILVNGGFYYKEENRKYRYPVPLKNNRVYKFGNHLSKSQIGSLITKCESLLLMHYFYSVWLRKDLFTDDELDKYEKLMKDKGWNKNYRQEEYGVPAIADIVIDSHNYVNKDEFFIKRIDYRSSWKIIEQVFFKNRKDALKYIRENSFDKNGYLYTSRGIDNTVKVPKNANYSDLIDIIQDHEDTRYLYAGRTPARTIEINLADF
jgi:hypothetical protein